MLDLVRYARPDHYLREADWPIKKKTEMPIWIAWITEEAVPVLYSVRLVLLH